MSKDKKQQQVNDDDVRNQVNHVLDWSEHYIETTAHKRARIDYFVKVMYLADPKELRMRSIRHFGVWLMKMADEKFAAFRWPFDYLATSYDQQLMGELITSELLALFAELEVPNGGSP